MSDFLTTTRDQIKARIDELEPLVSEHRELQRVLHALAGTAPTPAASEGRPRRGRPRGTGSRAQEALAIVTAEPGLTAGEIADKMGINQNYLYRVLPGLEEDGKLEKRGRGWHVAGS